MNELIKKVTEQAVVATEQELYRLSQSTDGMPAYKDVFNQKFAELIVRECAKVAGQEQIYNERNEIPVNIEESVLEHFGV